MKKLLYFKNNMKMVAVVCCSLLLAFNFIACKDSDDNDITFKFYYKAPKAKKYHIAYSTNTNDYLAVEAAINGKDSYEIWGDTIQLSDKADVLKNMLGK